jgi:glycosyltransferase involved in cell wall biosynthesis
MRVTHVIDSLDPRTGGPPAVTFRLASAQAALGAAVAVASIDRAGAREGVAVSSAGVPGIDRVRVDWIPDPGGSPVDRLLTTSLRRGVRPLVHSCDVLYLHGVWNPVIRATATEARLAGKPFALVPHGMLDPWSLRSTPAKRIKKWVALALAYRHVLNSAAYLHALNRDERDLMKPLGLRPPVEVIPNGVFLEEFADLPPRDEFARSRPDLRGRPFVLFLSRLHHKKGLDYLADAFARVAPKFPEARLVVAGPDGGALAPFREQVARLGLEPRVLVVGPLYGREKLAALTGAEVFCLPSRQEGFSMAITEALACGRPAVVSAACHFPEVAEAGAGLVVDLTAEAVAGALAAVLADPAHATRMGQAGRRLVETSFTWPRIAAMTLDALARHGAAPPA